MKYILCFLLTISSLYAETNDMLLPDSSTVLSLNSDTEVVNGDYELYRKSRKLRAGAIALATLGGAGAAFGLAMGGLMILVGYPTGLLFLAGGALFGALIPLSAPIFRTSREMRETSGVVRVKSREFRFSMQLQGYLDKNLTDHDIVLLGDPLNTERNSYIAEEETTAPAPIFCAELGVMLPSQVYLGIYGQLLYAGAMAVSFYEWHPSKHLYFSAGVKAGYMCEHWTEHSTWLNMETHHEQYGGPEFRASFGSKLVRVTGEFQLWIDRVAQYKYGDYGEKYDAGFGNIYGEELWGYAPVSREVGVSPAFSLKFQVGIPF